METQTNAPVVVYDSAEIHFELRMDSQADSETATKNLLDIVQKIVATRDRSCALDIKVIWRLC